MAAEMTRLFGIANEDTTDASDDGVVVPDALEKMEALTSKYVIEWVVSRRDESAERTEEKIT